VKMAKKESRKPPEPHTISDYTGEQVGKMMMDLCERITRECRIAHLPTAILVGCLESVKERLQYDARMACTIMQMNDAGVLDHILGDDGPKGYS